MRKFWRVRVGSTGRAREGRAIPVLVGVAVAAVLASSCQAPPSPTIASRARTCTVGVVGDSLAVGSMPYWEEAFTSRGCTLSFVDARGGRPTSEGVRVIEDLARQGRLPDLLVVALGTNDSVDPRTFGPRVQRVMAVAGDRPVVWVNIDKPWVEHTLNLALRLGNQLYPNLWVYDWNGVTEVIPQIRLADRIHLTDGGYRLRAALIANHVTGL